MNYEEYKKLAPEERGKYKKQTKQEYNQYQIEFEAQQKQFMNLKMQILEYPINQNAKSYITKKVHLYKKPEYYFDYNQCKKWEELITKEENEKKKQEQQAEAQNQEYRKTQKALTICLENGWKLGKPDKDNKEFILEQAMEIAFDIVFEKKVKENMKDFKYISFGGDDNCENCEGWDGESRRCQCGNRRVGWEADGDFEDLYIYAMAW